MVFESFWKISESTCALLLAHCCFGLYRFFLLVLRVARLNVFIKPEEQSACILPWRENEGEAKVISRWISMSFSLYATMF